MATYQRPQPVELFTIFWFFYTKMKFVGVYVLIFGLYLFHVGGFQVWHPFPSGWRLPAAQAEPYPQHKAFDWSVVSFEEGTVHPLSDAFNSVVEDVAVDHVKKWLVAAKVFTETVLVNTFNVADIDQLFDTFDLNQGTGQEYKVVIVGLNGMNLPKPTGTDFAWKNRTESLDWWQNETRTNSPFAWPNSLRIKTYLMRVPAYDMPAFELPGEKGKRKKK